MPGVSVWINWLMECSFCNGSLQFQPSATLDLLTVLSQYCSCVGKETILPLNTNLLFGCGTIKPSWVQSGEQENTEFFQHVDI